MATNVFDLFARISLDSSEFRKAIDGISGMMGKTAEGVGSLIKGTISLVGDLAEKGIQKASGALTGFLKSSVQTGQTFEQAIAGVSATLGRGSEEVIGQLREFAMEMGATTKYTATEAANALNYMALAGYNAEVSMQMLPNVMNLATAGAMDLAKASDVLTDAASAFGLDVAHNEEDMERVNQLIDEMAKAASTGNTSVEQLGDAFLTIGGLAAELNGRMITLADGTQTETDGLQELQTALVAMANAGVKGSEAGTHMRNIITKLSSPTDDATEMMEEMGVAVFDTAGKMRSLTDIFGDLNKALGTKTQEEKIKTISELFNARDLASAQALLKSIETSWDDIELSILDSDGAAAAMVEKQIDTLQGQRTIMESAIDGLKIRIAEGLNPVLKEFATLGAEAFSDFTDAYEKAGVWGLFQEMSVYSGELLKAVKKYLPQAMNIISMFVKSVAKNLPKVLSELIPEVLAGIGGFIDMMTEPSMLQGIIDSGAKLLAVIFESVLKSYSKLADVALAIVQGLAQYLTENAGELAQSAAQMIADFAISLREKGTLSKLVSSAIDIVNALADALLDPDTLDLIISAGIDIILALTDAFAENIGKITEAAGKILTALITYFTTDENVEKLAMAGMQIIIDLVSGLGDAVSTVYDWVMKTAEDIADYFGFGDYWRAGKDTIDEFMGGVLEAWNKWKGFWEGIGEYIYDSLHNEEGELDLSGTDTLNEMSEGLADARGTDTSAPLTAEERAKQRAEMLDPERIKQQFRLTQSKNAAQAGGSAAMEAMRKARGYSRGTIVNKPTNALIGEAGAEAVIPLENNTGWIDKVAERIGGNGVTVDTINVNMNGVTLANGYDTQQAVRDIISTVSQEMRVLQVNDSRAIGGTGAV